MEPPPEQQALPARRAARLQPMVKQLARRLKKNGSVDAADAGRLLLAPEEERRGPPLERVCELESR